MTTRPEPGAVDAALTALGATVLHMPLIVIVDVDPMPDGRSELTCLLDSLEPADPPSGETFLVVTSAAGANRVEPRFATSALRLAAVGTATAAVLTDRLGRPVDIVPSRQTAADLIDAFPDPQPGDRVIVARADRAAPTLVDGLRARGFAVVDVVAYRTELRIPAAASLAAALAADAVVFASGSAAQAWAQAVGTDTPSHVIAIGPTTASVARELGLRVTTVADDHSVDGLVAATVDALNA